MTPEDIITDEELDRVHANANFGATSKRDVIKWSLLKYACGYSNGSTARAILIEHGLVNKPKDPYKDPTLRAKGRQYLWACFGKHGV